jgi:DNA-binding transcriptional LysR family regulator
MDRRWLPLNALRAFEAVARHGSFTAAANALLISQSSLSRHVMLIEKQIDTLLFERKPHALTLTEPGRRLASAVGKAFDRLDSALAEIEARAADVRLSLHIQMPPSFASVLAVPILKDFRAQFPSIALDVVSPLSIGQPSADVDVAVVYSKPQVSDAVCDLLWPVRLQPLCHPSLRAKYAGLEPQAFIAACEIVHVRVGDLPRFHFWTEFTRTMTPRPNVERGLVFDTALMAAQYAASGEAIALVDPQLFQTEIRDGRLIQAFDGQLDDGYGYYLITHADDLGDAPIALLRRWLIQRLGQNDSLPDPVAGDT